MTADPAVTRVFMGVGLMVCLVLAIAASRLLGGVSKTPGVEGVVYPHTAWGESLLAEEAIDSQATVVEPPSWLNSLLSSNIGRGHPTPRQLALTPNALLVALRQGEVLRERDRFERGHFQVSRVHEDGRSLFTIDLLLDGKRRQFTRVPAAFVARLRSRVQSQTVTSM